jgi:hypothetical protein
MIELKLQSSPDSSVSVFIPDGRTVSVELISSYLVSAGQTIPLTVSASVVQVEAGNKLEDGRMWAEEKLIAHVPVSFQYEYIPSDRRLYEILEDAVGHYALNPSHGVGCSCLDKYVRELKQHICRVVPRDIEDVESARIDSSTVVRVLLYRLARWV